MNNFYTIGMAAQLSGLTDLSIRTWENRYQAVKPKRSSGNQRLYSDEDVKRLSILAKGVKTGLRISTLVQMTNKEIEESIQKKLDRYENNYIHLAHKALKNLELNQLNELFESASIEMGVIQAMDEVIFPFMNQLGEHWNKGELNIYQEHLASETVNSFLNNQLRSYQSSKQNPIALIATLPGQVHNLGAAASAVTAAIAGFHTLNLGYELPSEELIKITKKSHAAVLGISIVFPGNTSLVRKELEVLHKKTPDHCRLILGGCSSRAFNTKQVFHESRDLQHFKEILLDFRNVITNGPEKNDLYRNKKE
ncbi:MerR family transcriptional regulator [Oceanispirochaeta crateris]|uniref:MerR family transcriptional regulator n=2 Tax=Oceanispirochaeta crateris TaxID=2518645 RepID=A0A5C1QQ56_9SPIO|nr:MerR family transcriptional regulator [Oceanispirochaeta crateris]